jgi:hypothetical protein
MSRDYPAGVASGGFPGVASASGDFGTAAEDAGSADLDGVDVTVAGFVPALTEGDTDGSDGAVDGVLTGPPGGAGSGPFEPGTSTRLTATAAIATPAGTGTQRHNRNGGRGAATVGGTPRLSRSCVI